MTRTIQLLFVVLLTPALGAAQGRPVVEIGTNVGVTVASSGGTTLTHFGVPGQGLLGQPTVYASVFAGASVLVEPQMALNIVSSEGETSTSVGLGGQVGYLFQGASLNSPFIAGALGFQSVSGGGFSESDFGIGGKVGYRVLIGSSVGLRFEGGYRRWFDSDLNEFTFGVAVGGIIRSPR